MDIIYVTGPVGVGKSTFIEALSKKGYGVVPEDADANPWLERFYEDPQRWAFHAQLCQHVEVLRGTEKILAEGGRWVVDRPARERYDIFVPPLVKSGAITIQEGLLLKELAASVDSLAEPDLVVALDGTVWQQI